MALSAALSAALLEKLLARPADAAPIRRIRTACLALAELDATVFGRVIQASRHGDRRRFAAALRKATDVPWTVFRHARAVRAACRKARRSVKPRFQSDLRCAEALAEASGAGAKILVLTNLAWLQDPHYTKQMKRRLAAAR